MQLQNPEESKVRQSDQSYQSSGKVTAPGTDATRWGGLTALCFLALPELSLAAAPTAAAAELLGTGIGATDPDAALA